MALRKPNTPIGPSVRNAGSLDARALVGNAQAGRRRAALIHVAAEKGLPAKSATSAALMLKGSLDTKAALRIDIAEVRQVLEEDRWPADVTVTNAEGKEVVVTLTSAREAKALLSALEDRFRQTSDLTQMQQLDLQDAMNKQAQAMQMISNIMKTQHDTLKSIINNLR